MEGLVKHKLINLYSDCQSQVEHDQVRYRVFNPLTIFKSLYLFSNLPSSSFFSVESGDELNKFCKN